MQIQYHTYIIIPVNVEYTYLSITVHLTINIVYNYAPHGKLLYSSNVVAVGRERIKCIDIFKQAINN